MPTIKIENVIKQYRNGVKALDNMNLQVENGEIFTLLGPNGAGKSTLINILTTYLTPTSGKVSIFGMDIYREPEKIRRQIACVAQRVSIDQHLSLEENLMFQARLYQVPSSVAKNRMRELIQCFGLQHFQNYPVSSYSGGVKRRLDIAMNLMSQPKLLFLDEPTTGMDIQSRIDLWKMMKRIRDEYGTTIFLTTHYLEEAEQLSDTICIMKDGREIIQGAPCNLYEYMHQDVLHIGFDTEQQAKNTAVQLRNTFCQFSVDLKDTSVNLRDKDIRKEFHPVNEWLLKQGIEFTSIEIQHPNLEDVFLTLTTDRKVVSA